MPSVNSERRHNHHHHAGDGPAPEYAGDNNVDDDAWADDDSDVWMTGGEDTAGIVPIPAAGSAVPTPSRSRVRRLRDESAEEQALRRRRREAMVLSEGGRPLGQDNIIQRPVRADTGEIADGPLVAGGRAAESDLVDGRLAEGDGFGGSGSDDLLESGPAEDEEEVPELTIDGEDLLEQADEQQVEDELEQLALDVAQEQGDTERAEAGPDAQPLQQQSSLTGWSSWVPWGFGRT